MIKYYYYSIEEDDLIIETYQSTIEISQSDFIYLYKNIPSRIFDQIFQEI